MSATGRTDSVEEGTPEATETVQQRRARSLRWPWLRWSSVTEVLPESSPAYVVLKRDSVYRRLLALGDILSSATALLVVLLAVGDDGLHARTILFAPLLLIVVKAIGLYDRDQYLLHKSTLDEGPKLFQVATLFTLIVWLSAPLWIQGTLDRTQLAVLWALLFGLMVLTRGGVRRIAGHLVPTERCVVIGDEGVAERLISKFGRTALVNARVLGRIPVSEAAEGGPGLTGNGRPAALAVPALGTLSELPQVFADHRVDRVIIAPGAEESDELFDLIRTAKLLGVNVSIVPRMLEAVGSSVAFDEVEGLSLLGLRHYGLSTSSAFLKRMFDLIGSGVLLTLLAPVFLFVALAIKLTSRGPVFFRQPRIGQHDQAFDMLKFRTMCEDAEERKSALQCRNEAEGLFKIADDPRITRIGRLLRRTSLDELPQLINVLRGEMSLVGPRPLIPEEDAMIDGLNRRRLRMPPGMTGQWQILGSARVPLREMVKIDYLYGANWSLWGDLKILVRTAAVVLGRRGL